MTDSTFICKESVLNIVISVESGKFILRRYGGITTLPVSQKVISKLIFKDPSKVSIAELLIMTLEESDIHKEESDHCISSIE
jgi:hypothetical protein